MKSMVYSGRARGLELILANWSTKHPHAAIEHPRLVQVPGGDGDHVLYVFWYTNPDEDEEPKAGEAGEKTS